jgi:hypothetical protein
MFAQDRPAVWSERRDLPSSLLAIDFTSFFSAAVQFGVRSWCTRVIANSQLAISEGSDREQRARHGMRRCRCTPGSNAVVLKRDCPRAWWYASLPATRLPG